MSDRNIDEQLPNPSPEPSGDGCQECLADGAWWFHLRRCLACGHIGCCDQSPGQHSLRHWQETGHRYLTTFEPEELWLWDYETNSYGEQMPELTPPLHHPLEQPTPGPAGAVPEGWEYQLHAS